MNTLKDGMGLIRIMLGTILIYAIQIHIADIGALKQQL